MNKSHRPTQRHTTTAGAGPATSTAKDYGSNGANADALAHDPPTKAQLAKATPAVVYANTDSDSADGITRKLGGTPDHVYEVTLTWAELVAWGGQGPIPGATDTGESQNRDYIELDGTPMAGDGSLSSTVYVDGHDSRPMTFRIANNGFLNLQRLAVGARGVAASYGANEQNGWVLQEGRTLDVLIGMKVGNDPKDADSRNFGYLAGIDPQELGPALNRAIIAAVAASEVERVGERYATQSIHETDLVGQRYRDRQPGDERLSWSDATLNKLNKELISLFTDRPGSPPRTYISGGLDFTQAIQELFGDNGSARHADTRSELDFLAEVQRILKSRVDLTWLDNTDAAFKDRFERHWQRNIDATFERVTWDRLDQERLKLRKPKQYVRGKYEVEQPKAMTFQNESGKVDGTGAFAMPDFSGWEGVAHEEEQEAGASEVAPVDQGSGEQTPTLDGVQGGEEVDTEAAFSELDEEEDVEVRFGEVQDEEEEQGRSSPIRIIDSGGQDKDDDGFKVHSSGDDRKKKRRRRRRRGRKKVRTHVRYQF